MLNTLAYLQGLLITAQKHLLPWIKESFTMNFIGNKPSRLFARPFNYSTETIITLD